MTDILLVGGIKGGVGKTLVCRTCIEYLNQQGFSTVVINSDREVKDISGFYESKLITFSDDFRKVTEPDKILEIAEESNPDYIVINLPGNTHQPLQDWLITTDSIKSRKAPEDQPQFVQFFVTDGCWSSIELFLKSISEHDDKLPHVLIRNSGRLMSSSDWSYLEKVKEYQEALEKHCILILDFPLVATPVLFELDRRHLTFQKAVEGSNSLLARRTGFFINQYTQMFNSLFEQLPELIAGTLKTKRESSEDSDSEKETISNSENQEVSTSESKEESSAEDVSKLKNDLASRLNKDLEVVTQAIIASNSLKELATNLSVSEKSLGINSKQFAKMKEPLAAEASVV